MRSVSFLLAALTACGRFDFGAVGSPDAADAAGGAVDAVDANELLLPTFVQTAAASGLGSNLTTLAFDSDVTAGDLILVAVDLLPAMTITLVGVTDTQGNTYATAGPFDGLGDARHYLGYAIAATTGPATVTSTLTTAPTTDYDLRVHEYAGTALVNPIEATNSMTGTTSGVDSASSGAVTTSEANELIFGYVTFSADGVPGTGFTVRSMQVTDFSEDQLAPTPGSYEALATMTSSASWTAIVAAVRAR